MVVVITTTTTTTTTTIIIITTTTTTHGHTHSNTVTQSNSSRVDNYCKSLSKLSSDILVFRLIALAKPDLVLRLNTTSTTSSHQLQRLGDKCSSSIVFL